MAWNVSVHSRIKMPVHLPWKHLQTVTIEFSQHLALLAHCTNCLAAWCLFICVSGHPLESHPMSALDCWQTSNCVLSVHRTSYAYLLFFEQRDCQFRIQLIIFCEKNLTPLRLTSCIRFSSGICFGSASSINFYQRRTTPFLAVNRNCTVHQFAYCLNCHSKPVPHNVRAPLSSVKGSTAFLKSFTHTNAIVLLTPPICRVHHAVWY